MTELKDQIEEAQRQVAIRQRIADKPGSTVDDELRLQCARNWLLTLDNRRLQRLVLAQSKPKPTEHLTTQPKRLTPREQAEQAFSICKKAGA